MKHRLLQGRYRSGYAKLKYILIGILVGIALTAITTFLYGVPVSMVVLGTLAGTFLGLSIGMLNCAANYALDIVDPDKVG